MRRHQCYPNSKQTPSYWTICTVINSTTTELNVTVTLTGYDSHGNFPVLLQETIAPNTKKTFTSSMLPKEYLSSQVQSLNLIMIEAMFPKLYTGTIFDHYPRKVLCLPIGDDYFGQYYDIKPNQITKKSQDQDIEHIALNKLSA